MLLDEKRVKRLLERTKCMNPERKQEESKKQSTIRKEKDNEEIKGFNPIGRVHVVAEQEENAAVRVKAITAKQTYQFRTDEPHVNGGDETAPTPVHTLVGALSACLETNWIYYTSFAKLDVESIKVEVHATIDRRFILGREEFPARLKSIFVKSFISTNEPKHKFNHVFQKVRNLCPVGGSLHPKINLSFENIFKSPGSN